MGLFSRRREDRRDHDSRRAGDDSKASTRQASRPSGQVDPAAARTAAPAEGDSASSSTQGPWDAANLPKEQEEVTRVDLGALRVPAVDGMQVRLEQAPGGVLTAAVLALGGSSLELRAFAAPKSSGVWDELRADIAQSLSGAGARYQEVEGDYGTEVLAQIPMRAPDGATSMGTVRFIGVDGPRWFLRAVLQGPAASSTDPSEELREVLRRTVVVRDEQARPPREVLPLHAPGAAAAPEAEELPGLDPLAPGPTVAEVR
ncbi:DUF3710 domain-containing protein [Actinomyces sp. 2119]|uniref:DUF3710 domain-containing protein n=1 Tax=Actinomyces lilanjuaniae TaxID=2321394 RepID=A0ABM6Z4M9_9ACTO|nr:MULTISPECIES: DUF3710 domain-containing protein [Actinomyces]AYD89879.1 DUF3710 domain-containing protein [Actinomyces lilanjuaniae]RJF44869.1 DUF3710 domain-containing protein [Actinomyces sp. 2119]